jgi:hypothetical protein
MALLALLALTDWLHSPVSVAVMSIASLITVVGQRLSVHGDPEISRPFWSGRALGTQNTG